MINNIARCLSVPGRPSRPPCQTPHYCNFICTVGQRKKVTAVTFFRCPTVIWASWRFKSSGTLLFVQSTGGFPSHGLGNVESGSIPWGHHEMMGCGSFEIVHVLCRLKEEAIRSKLYNFFYNKNAFFSWYLFANRHPSPGRDKKQMGWK